MGSLYSVQLLPVILSAIAAMGLGFLWYSPLLFGKQWMKLKGYTPKSLKEAQSKMGPKYGLSFAVWLLQSFVVGKFIVTLGATGAVEGVQIAALLWLGLAATIQLTNWIFSEAKFNLYLIDTGYQLVSMLAAGAILGMWA